MKHLSSEQFGPWALVTGASSGIGKAFCEHLAASGFNLLIVARRKTLLQKLASDLEAKHQVSVDICDVDLGQNESVHQIQTHAEGKDIGLLVLNAGFGYKGDLEAQPLSDLNAMITVNAITPTLLAHAFLPTLKARSKSGIIFTGSIEGETPFPHSSVYAATKAYIHGLGASLYGECQGTSVDVLALSPGSTDTEAPIKQGFTRDQLIGVMSPEAVAGEALAKLGKTPLWITGLHNRIFIRLLRFLPRKTATVMAGKGLMKAIEASKA